MTLEGQVELISTNMELDQVISWDELPRTSQYYIVPVRSEWEKVPAACNESARIREHPQRPRAANSSSISQRTGRPLSGR